jgi:Uma2 family endonuclease
MDTKAKATLTDLYQVPENGKAELVDGELVLMSPTGGLPGYAGGEIFASLREHARRTRTGVAFPDNVGFAVNLPNRLSFSPDAAFYTGPNPGMDFPAGAPVFAAEVRSGGDYSPQAEREMAQKRADYFAAGTLVVWDVDLLSPVVIRSYRADSPDQPMIFRRGEVASAEPAVPGWTMPVDDLFL